MKTISMRAWANKKAEIQTLATTRIDELREKEYRVEVLQEDIQEELLKLCRGHAHYLCSSQADNNPFFLWKDETHKDFTVEWIEAGEQVYAMWRGWV